MFQGMMQGGGKAGLLGDPLFQVGMGLLAKGQDNRIPYATAVMGGLQNAQTAQDQSTQRQLLQEQARRQKEQRERYNEMVERLYPNVAGEMTPQPVPSATGAGLQMQMMGPPAPQESQTASLLKVLGPQTGGGLLGAQRFKDATLPGSRGEMFSRLQRTDPNSPEYSFLYTELNKPYQRPGPGGVMEVVPGNPLVGIPKPGSGVMAQGQAPSADTPEKILPPAVIKIQQNLRANVNAYNNYIDKIQTIGRPTSMQDVRELNAAFQTLLLQAKELFNLGVLQEADLEILKEVTPSMTDLKGFIEGPDAAIQQLQAGLLPKLMEGIAGFERDYATTYDEVKPKTIDFSQGEEFELNAQSAAKYKGETAEQDGVRYESDGKQWIKVN